MPGFPVHHQLLEVAQTHVYRVSDAIQPSFPLSSPSPPAFNLSLGTLPVWYSSKAGNFQSGAILKPFEDYRNLHMRENDINIAELITLPSFTVDDVRAILNPKSICSKAWAANYHASYFLLSKS